MADLVTRVYSGFRGVDFRGEEVNLLRSPDAVNIYKDYKETDSIRTRPDFGYDYEFGKTIYGIYPYKIDTLPRLIIHAGNTLYEYYQEEGIKTLLYEGVEEVQSNAFIYNNVFYFKDGKNYLQYDGVEIKEVVGYIPTTSIGRKPSGGGTIHEDVNMLSDYRINTFVADGESKDFYLDEQDIDMYYQPEITVNGEVAKARSYDFPNGKISFDFPPAKPLTDGQDNVVIKFRKKVSGYADKIKKCTLLQVFDNRVFFSGNPDYPNVIFHCSLNDPTYCSDLDYYTEGLDTGEVKGLVAGNNVLWVFKEPNTANTTVFYHVPTIDSEYGKIYPSTHSSISTGCVGKAINFNDDIIFFSSRGMEGINGDITTEQAIAHRSSLVDRKLLAEADYQNMILEEWEGYLLVIIGDKVYLADSRAKFTNEDHYEYEWFYWSLGKKITCAKVYDGVLYLGTDNGVLYEFNRTWSNVESYWITPKDKFKYPNMQKTSNKRGCVVEATGDISVYAKTEKTDFELIDTYENVTDYFVSRIKRKKFKDLQLKFYSNTRFSLETATFEVFVGGYIKR